MRMRSDERRAKSEAKCEVRSEVSGEKTSVTREGGCYGNEVANAF